MALDARQLYPLAQEMIDKVIPMAESEKLDGDFTIELKVIRKNGKALCDVNLKVKK